MSGQWFCSTVTLWVDLGAFTAQELGLWGWSLDPGKHQARSFLAAFSLLHGPHHGFALSTQNLSPDKIFHVIVAPCYDKKLEALQEDVPTASRGSRGTDCVLTSGEGGLGKGRWEAGQCTGPAAAVCPR